MISNEVKQGIVIGFVKNLDIISSSLATQKINEWEHYASDMSSIGQILSDLISDPETFQDPSFLKNY